MSGLSQSLIAAFSQRLDDAAMRAVATPQLSLDAAMAVDEAYRVQAGLIDARVGRGEKIIGMKMGFTSRAKMVQMGLSTMIFGRLTGDMLVEEGGSTPHAKYIHPRVEPEIAFCLRKSLSGPISLLEAADAVEWIAPALEIIDSRYKDFKFSLPDVIADNSSSSGIVIGAARKPEMDIANLGMVMSMDGVAREIGSSAAILGNPWRSLVAAAGFAGTYGFTLQPGDIVMAGGATAAIAASVGSQISLETQGMGPVLVNFAA